MKDFCLIHLDRPKNLNHYNLTSIWEMLNKYLNQKQGCLSEFVLFFINILN